jgi:hypothetical protein
MWFEFKGMHSIYEQAYCIFLFILFFYYFGFMKKRVSMVWGKKKTKEEVLILVHSPFSLHWGGGGGVCKRSRDYYITKK